MIEKLKERFSRLSLRAKLVLASVLLILAPMMTLGAISGVTLMIIAGEQSEDAYRQTMRQMTMHLSAQAEAVETAVRSACSNSRLSFILRHMLHEELTPGKEYDYYQEIKAVKENIAAQTGATRVRMALRAEATFIKSYFDLFPEEILLEEAVCAEDSALLAGRWFAPGSFSSDVVNEERGLCYCAELIDVYSVNAHQGYLLVQLDADEFFSTLSAENLAEGACVLVLQGDEVFYAAGDEEALADARRLLLQHDSDSLHANYQLVRGRISLTGWEVVMLTPQALLQRQSRGVQNSIFAMALILSGIAVACAFWLTGSMNRRLRAILSALQRMEEGEFGDCMPVEGYDEYAVIMQEVNTMSVRTGELLQEQRVLQKQIQQAEMRALYEQINPHFIYNTLDVIRWQVLSGQNEATADLTKALIQYLRLNLNHGRELTNVQSEVEEVRQYMHIMNFRYRDCIDFSAWVEPEVALQPVLKLILQPLVENAVLHGVMCREDRRGRICVRAFHEQGTLVYTVEDNGVGMPQEEADRLTAEMREKSYGVYSVSKRLKTFYGPQSGLVIRTAPGKGCLVRVEIALGHGVALWR